MRRLLVALAILLVIVLSGCASTRQPKAGGSGTPTPSASPTVAIAPAPAPRVGQCRVLNVNSATDATNESPSVPCTRRHTAVTVFVGRLDPIVDGHLVAADSTAVRRQTESACKGRLGAFTGGSLTDQRLSRFEVVWFRPSVEQADRGATWIRCDLVLLGQEASLAPLPAKARGLLDSSSALDHFGTCGTSAPGTPKFRRVLCDAPHTWRAVSVIDLPAGTRYLGKDAGSAANASCKDIAAGRANGALKYTWSFEWPANDQWAAGQRYGYCWIPG